MKRFRKELPKVFSALIGALLYGVGVTVFINPHRVLLGGATGIATVLRFLFEIPLGLSVIVLNIPLLLLSYKIMGKKFTALAIVGTLLLSVSLEITGFLPPFEGDRLLSTLCGAVLTGSGCALINARGVMTGGTDLLAILLQRKFPFLSFSGLILILDAVIIVLGGLVYREAETVLYSLLLAVIYSLVLNNFLKGRTEGRIAWIISKKPLSQAIIEGTGHAVTMMNGVGGYTGDGRFILVCAMNPGEEKLVRRIVYRNDPEAFMMVAAAAEIIGNGFQEFNREAIQ